MINVNEMSQSFYTAFMLMEALYKPKCFCLLSKWRIIIPINLYIFHIIAWRVYFVHSYSSNSFFYIHSLSYSICTLFRNVIEALYGNTFYQYLSLSKLLLNFTNNHVFSKHRKYIKFRLNDQLRFLQLHKILIYDMTIICTIFLD